MKRRIVVLLIVLVVLSGLIGGGIYLVRWGYDKYERAAYPVKYEAYVTKYAAEYDLQPSLIYAIIRTESRFDPNAVSAAGAKGLMQLMEVTYDWTQSQFSEEPEPPERIFDPEVNVRCGCKYLQYCFSKFENTQAAIAAYNAGVGRVSGWLADSRYSNDGVTLKAIPIEETRNYVEYVLEAQAIYQRLYQPDGEE